MLSDAVSDAMLWVYLFLTKTFFSACGIHPNIFGNHEKYFCIDCETAACKHCLAGGTHAHHRLIKVYRDCFKDVVNFHEINTHIDCSGIQSYVYNGRLVISLNPLPHMPEDRRMPRNVCHSCARKFMEWEDCEFCSIACKEGHSVWWLYMFLARTFFLECGRHSGFRNYQNKYCIDCDMAACQHCMAEGTHNNHRVITVYRLVQKNVVSLDQMKEHTDCSGIQTYASNGKQVLALHPLPHDNSGQNKLTRACLTCTRVLMNPHIYNYCSIACKLSNRPAAADKGDAGSKYGAGAGRRDGGGGGAGAVAGKRSNRSYSRLRKRKRVPHRSPLF